MNLENAIARYFMCKGRVITSEHDVTIDVWAETMRGTGLNEDRLIKLTLEACAKPGYCEVASIIPQPERGDEEFA